MKFVSWDSLPPNMKNESVKRYYEIIAKKKKSLICKRLFDLIVSIFMLIIMLPLFLLISVIIKIDSKGPVFYRQVRVTQFGRRFKILKFRTMVNDADKIGTLVTTNCDKRITGIGRVLRKLRLDEIPQFLNIISGDMTFVGTRPEVPKYTEQYTDEMMATLLMPAGVTSEASILYKDEEKLISNSEDADRTYAKEVLPEKMKYNLDGLINFSFFNDIKTMVRTAFAVIVR
ncbi:MAG TPA: sugar transferase [Clostridia bacterium]